MKYNPAATDRKLNIPEAIAKMEGFLTVGSIPQRQRNPGDIIAGPFAKAHGAIEAGTTGNGARFAVFPDDDTGFAALVALLRTSAYRGLTVAGMVERYAPPSENATASYIASVCRWTGLTADTIIDDYLDPIEEGTTS